MVRRLAFLRSILIFKKIDIYKCPKKEKPKNSLKNEFLTQDKAYLEIGLQTANESNVKSYQVPKKNGQKNEIIGAV